MAATRGASLAEFVFVLLLHTSTGLQSADTECAFSDQIQGAEPHSGPTNELRGTVTENGTVRCSHGSRCYGLWKKRPDGEIQLVKQGCWTHIGSQEECRSERCLVSAPPSQVQNGSYRFCCCSRDLCNVNFTEAPPTADTPALRLIKTDDRQAAHQPLRREESALIALVTVAIAAIAIIALFLGYRMMKGKKKQRSLSAVDVMEANTDAAVELDNLKLLELIGRGRYGTVFRGCLNERCVAVKLFSSANRQNYANERSIYSLPLLQQHDNIARFLSADERTTADGRPEFLIIMDFYPNGCLSRYLSVHTVDWSTCCRMTHGVTRGLAFLHNELYRGDKYKPAVAHRDVSSRNVLVRADLSCVLADFGLSMRLTGSRPCCPGDDDTMAISEVGTVRYMAPEVLGGALNLRDCEAALKQVDVYALGLLLWESFRRCSHLFPGEVVPEYELAFQAELGNHPSFEEMQILVAREKFRPRFPEAWKKNSLVLRSLKETMEDCWDQDAEARLTAQCAEERLSELSLLNTHTATHNHRNLSHCSSSIHVSSTPTYIADHQVGVVNCLQGESQQASAIKTTTSAAEAAEKNRNSINQEQQQRQTLACSSHNGVLCSVSELENGPVGGAGISVPICLQLTEEDLEPTKVDPKQVDKNLRKSSDENLKELPQKHFGSTEIQTSSLLSQQILQTAQANKLVLTPHFEPFGGTDPPRLPRHPLPKQQNLPLRPTSLHLLSKTTESPSASSQLKQGKSNHRQVETGVAKMNTVTINGAVEPHLVTTVSNSIMRCGVAAVPSLITNGMIVGGQSNPAGPLLENEDTMARGVTAEEDNCLNLLNFSPDEHQPLLQREQLPAETTPTSQPHHQPKSRPGNGPPTQGSNSNNNNNRTALGSHIMFQGSEAGLESWSQTINHPEPEPHLPSQHISKSSDPLSCVENKVLLSNPGKNIISSQVTMPQAPPSKDQGSSTGPCVQKASFLEPVLAPQTHRNPKSHLVQSTASSLVPGDKDTDCGSASSQAAKVTNQTSALPSTASDAQSLDPKASVQEPLSKNRNILPLVASGNMDPKNIALESEDQEIVASVLELQSPALVPQGSAILRPQRGLAKAKRPERPSSLDLSSAGVSTDDVPLMENGSLSSSGEKIKRRVKTPYTLKKWRPASWVVSTDTAFDLDLEFDHSGSTSGQILVSSGAHIKGSVGVPKINQSKSSMAVFLVGGGATATTTAEPDGITSF